MVTALDGRLGQSRMLIALLVVLTAMAPVSLQIFLPALPAIQATFAASSAKTQLVLSLSILANAFATLAYGPLSDRFGRRPVMLAGVVIFILGSLLCALAGSLLILIIGRIIQSAGAAAGMVLARAIVRDLYERDAAAQVIAYLTMAMVLGPMLAPTAGALLIDHIGWRAIFAVTLAVGLLTGWLTVVHLVETRPGRAGQAAWSGLIRGGSQLLRMPAFLAYTLQSSFAIATFFAFISGAPYFMIGTLGFSATDYGLCFVVISGAFMVGNFIAARVSARVGIDRMILLGAVMVLLGAVLMQACMLAGWWTLAGLFGPMLLAAFGNGLAIANAQAGAISVVPTLAGTASGIAGFVQLIAAAAASQLVGMASHDTPLPMAAGVLLCAIGGVLGFVLPRRQLARGLISARH